MITTDKPSFIVVGPPRTGTSWLHSVLEPYATLPSPSKETRFFDLHFHRGFDWYWRHFPRHRNGPAGEIAPTYFASAQARRRIAQTIPTARIIFIFRHPLERAVSLYRLKLAYGRLRCSFADALRDDPELIRTGLYWSQLAGWRALFPDEQLLVTIYDDLVGDPHSFANRIASFIGLPPIPLSQSQLQRMYSSERMTRPWNYLLTRSATAFADWCKSKHLDRLVASVRQSALINLFLGGGKSLPAVSPVALNELAQIFLPEIAALETQLGRKLEHWKSGIPHREWETPETGPAENRAPDSVRALGD